VGKNSPITSPISDPLGLSTRILAASIDTRLKVISMSNVETSTDFYLGDRVTLFEKYMLRAGDIGTVEKINSQGIQILGYSPPTTIGVANLSS
jgi:hypothetical protein